MPIRHDRAQLVVAKQALAHVAEGHLVIRANVSVACDPLGRRPCQQAKPGRSIELQPTRRA